MASSERPRRRATAKKEGPRVVGTFLFTDLVKSTDIRSALIRKPGKKQGNEAFRKQIGDPHDERIAELVKGKGKVISTAGDSFFVVFDDAHDAVECGVAIQRSLARNPIPIPIASKDLPSRVHIRIGMHTGAATRVLKAGRPNLDDLDIAIAHRVQEHAESDQILVTETTQGDAGEITGVAKREWPGYALKGVDGRWTLVEILWDERKPRRPHGAAADRHLLQRYLREVWETSVRL